MILEGKTEVLGEKSCPTFTLCTTNPTQNALKSNIFTKFEDLSAVLLAVLVICDDSDVSDKRCVVFVCHAVQRHCLLSLGCLTLGDNVTRFLRNVGFTKRRGVASRRHAAPLILAAYLLW
jgi:hypothetical protein